MLGTDIMHIQVAYNLVAKLLLLSANRYVLMYILYNYVCRQLGTVYFAHRTAASRACGFHRQEQFISKYIYIITYICIFSISTQYKYNLNLIYRSPGQLPRRKMSFMCGL